MAATKHINDVHFSQTGEDIFFLTSEDGIGKIFHGNNGGEAKIISSTFNVRGSVGYGGGGFHAVNDKLVFCEKSGSIYSVDLDNNGIITEILPPFLRTCTPRLSPDGKWVMFVYEKNDINGLGITSTNGSGWPRQLVLGADFYMHPTWHPNGEMVAWAEWHHPNMPWEASRIKIGQVGGMQLRLFEEKYIDGKSCSAANQPIFSPDGKWLSYIKQEGNWDSLILYNLKTKEKVTAITGDSFHLRMPDWIHGLHSYQWTADSHSITFIKYRHGTAHLAKLDIQSGRITPVDVKPYVWLSQVDISTKNNNIIFIGSSTETPDEIVQFDGSEVSEYFEGCKKKGKQGTMLQEVTFSNRDGQTGYAWYYSPTNQSDAECPPPCIIKLHSGPTSLKHAGYTPEAEYFTSRGYAIAYLNYRGSVSFGYEYQHALHLKWGEVEVEDTLDLINTLSKQKLINRNHLAVMGSSAGGFSVLHLLIKHPGLFKAAICSYAVSDLVDDAENTHKFEKYYHRFLTGEYPAEKDKFVQRSPITHIDKITDPIALFHGSKDPVVSAEQSQKIFDLLREKGVPCSLKIYEGEGHGFRSLENIEDYFQSVIAFLEKHI